MIPFVCPFGCSDSFQPTLPNWTLRDALDIIRTEQTSRQDAEFRAAESESHAQKAAKLEASARAAADRESALRLQETREASEREAKLMQEVSLWRVGAKHEAAARQVEADKASRFEGAVKEVTARQEEVRGAAEREAAAREAAQRRECA